MLFWESLANNLLCRWDMRICGKIYFSVWLYLCVSMHGSPCVCVQCLPVFESQCVKVKKISVTPEALKRQRGNKAWDRPQWSIHKYTSRTGSVLIATVRLLFQCVSTPILLWAGSVCVTYLDAVVGCSKTFRGNVWFQQLFLALDASETAIRCEFTNTI